ncbi:MAG: CoB--CoM heterodisulfide reductase subunit C [Candidatus Thorarchaeota archaeon]|nr:CoB--CoM heterodisulfide reductase subunit C [Candidatus Thorarchaeota archaeon]
MSIGNGFKAEVLALSISRCIKLVSVEEKVPIDIDEVDKDFVAMVKKAGGPNIQSCYQCGTCSGSCPAGPRTNYLVRGIIRKALLGLKEECISSPELWFCTTCYTCTDRCPQDVQPTEVIKAIRNVAVQSGYMLEPHQKVAINVLKTGHAVPLGGETWEKLRQKVGLEMRPPNASSYPDAVEEIVKIAKKSGFDKLVAEKEEEKKE